MYSYEYAFKFKDTHTDIIARKTRVLILYYYIVFCIVLVLFCIVFKK